MAEGRAFARLRFDPDWREAVEGELVAGGRLAIAYAAERRHQLFGGRMLEGIVAHARFEPGGEVGGGRLGTDPLVLDVPAGARVVVLWFGAVDHAGRAVWDSRWGQNYRFPVAPGPA